MDSKRMPRNERNKNSFPVIAMEPHPKMRKELDLGKKPLRCGAH
jgi:hypothetical protein